MEMVDDATGPVCLKSYMSITTVSTKSTEKPTGKRPQLEGHLTHCGRAMRELGVQLILVNPPQANGRVERQHGVMQDWLINVMRLKEVSLIEAANRLCTMASLRKMIC